MSKIYEIVDNELKSVDFSELKIGELFVVEHSTKQLALRQKTSEYEYYSFDFPHLKNHANNLLAFKLYRVKITAPMKISILSE